MPSPHFPSTLLPFEDLSELQSGFSQHRQDHLRRAQREALATRILLPLTGGPESFKERRQGENGGKKNEALTSIAGGLQAVSREKGGFGFRFGRKRWTDWRRRSLRHD